MATETCSPRLSYQIPVSDIVTTNFLYLKVVKTVAKNSNIVGNKFSIFKIFFVCH